MVNRWEELEGPLGGQCCSQGKGMATWTNEFQCGWTDRHGHTWETQSRAHCRWAVRTGSEGWPCSTSAPQLEHLAHHGHSFSSLSLLELLLLLRFPLLLQVCFLWGGFFPWPFGLSLSCCPFFSRDCLCLLNLRLYAHFKEGVWGPGERSLCIVQTAPHSVSPA